MNLRRPLRLPILLAIVMIALLAVLTVGWVLLSVFGAMKDERLAGFYWALLLLGSTFILLVLAGVVFYLILMIKAINLSRRQSNFIDSVTHELKSPIASMKLYLQTLGRHQVSAQEQAGFYRSMLEDLERLDRLINQLLAAASVEAGQFDGFTEEVDLSGLLAECAAAVCQSYHLPSETVRLDCTPCVVRAGRADLELVFRNLIDNAVKYAGTPPRAEVTLRCAPHGQPIVAIADNGRGIPRHLRRKIFGRFVRLGSELERVKPGTGLGLYIVRGALRRLGGRIRVLAREDGPGSIFEVWLPTCLVQADAVAAADPPKNEETIKDSGT